MFDRLYELLSAHKARFRVIHHAAEGNSERVAAVRGTHVSQGAKAMLCRTKEDAQCLLLAVLPGDRRIDFRKVARAVGSAKVSLAPPEEAMARTGCAIGAIPPFALSDELRLIVDPSLLARHDEIAFNAGRLDASIVLDAEDYRRIARPLLADICADA